MSNSTRSVLLHKNHIELVGFDTVQKCATFCLYPGGIVISTETLLNETCHYKVAVKNDKIYDDDLIRILRGRGFSECEHFIFHEPSTYIETNPHPAT